MLFSANSHDLPADPIGAAWLCRTFSLEPISPLTVLSQIGGRRFTHQTGALRLETYQESMRPAETFEAHLQFHLRHEVPHLEFLARLFQKAGPSALQTWVNDEPSGQYSRRSAFLYEWLTGDKLHVPERLGGKYVDVLDGASLITASPSRTLKTPRWRVNDNMPGTPQFCPMIVRTDLLNQAANLNIPALLDQLTAELGDDLLQRAAVWLTLRESKASFAIEGEADRATRIQRFADVLARRTGQGEIPLSDAILAQLQAEILGSVNTLERLGIRQSPVFVGETVRYQEIVHYVAPPPSDLTGMLEGLAVFLQRTSGLSPVLRSSVASFAFVYIHPLADGNGRLHRFLINDILRRDSAIPETLVLPVSAVISDDPAERRAYDRVLDLISKPLMERVREEISFASERTRYPDGVVSNIAITPRGEDDARPAWRYPNLSPHVVFMAGIFNRTINEQMREESLYLQKHVRARQAIKDIVEMPDHQVDRLLRSMEQNDGKLSNVLAKEMPVLTKPGVWDAIRQAVSDAFGK